MKKILFFVSLLIISYFFWLKTDRNILVKTQKEITIFQNFGDSTNNKGNLIGLQVFMNPEDYANLDNFKTKIKSYFEIAKQKNSLIKNKTIVVLPEYLGTWLVVLNEKNSVYQAKKIEDALQTLVLSHPFDFLKSLIGAPKDTKDKVKHAVFAMKSSEMAANYQAVFSEIAKEYQVIIVAGSILLQNPKIENTKILTNHGALKNVSFMFDSKGILHPQIIEKAFPTADELPFVTKSLVSKNIFKTPIGNMKVLICADAWFEEMYKSDNVKVDFVVVPSYSSGVNNWDKPWQGYSGFETPKDAKNAVKKISLGQAWQEFAMAGRAKKAKIKYGMNVFLQGNLWDLGADGSTIVLNDSTIATKDFNTSAIYNLWLQ